MGKLRCQLSGAVQATPSVREGSKAVIQTEDKNHRTKA
jgi:hypothetical protein